MSQVGAGGRPPLRPQLVAVDEPDFGDLDRGVDGPQLGQVVVQLLARSRLVVLGVHEADDERALFVVIVPALRTAARTEKVPWDVLRVAHVRKRQGRGRADPSTPR